MVMDCLVFSWQSRSLSGTRLARSTVMPYRRSYPPPQVPTTPKQRLSLVAWYGHCAPGLSRCDYRHYSHQGPKPLTSIIRRYCMDSNYDSGLSCRQYICISVSHEVGAQCVMPLGHCVPGRISSYVPGTRYLVPGTAI